MRTLHEIYENYQSPEGHGDKGTAHTYIDEYQRLLEPYRHNSNFLEIGLYMGESLLMWEEYFINSNVFGVDVSSKFLTELIKDGGHKIIINDATKVEILDNFTNIDFDVIIDDGSHFLNDQIITFNIFKNKIRPGGIFIIEDVENIDENRNLFLSLHKNVEIIDNRHIKGRTDDVLVVIKF
jgi:SAM-dependent methyltransferase